MPTRFIKESCRSSRNLDRLSDFEERLFWRLLTTADDYGRFMADPELVRAACFPYRSISLEKVTDALNGLQSHHLITLYTVGDRQYGEFVTFQKHQGRPRSKSRYPEKRNMSELNELDTSLQADARTCMQVQTVLASGASPPNTNTNLNSSLNSLNSSDLRAISVPERIADEGSDFENFWMAYPKKVGKKDARRAWMKARDKPPLLDILIALKGHKESAQWQRDQGQYIPNPATWLNQGRWDDKLAQQPKSLMQEFLERGTHGSGAILQGMDDAHFTTLGRVVPRAGRSDA